jgi:hypothetical protein
MAVRSSRVEGSHCPLAARGYSRDGKRGTAQIEYGLLTDPAGRPVAVRVFAGDTADPVAFVEAVTIVHENFGLEQTCVSRRRGPSRPTGRVWLLYRGTGRLGGCRTVRVAARGCGSC